MAIDPGGGDDPGKQPLSKLGDSNRRAFTQGSFAEKILYLAFQLRSNYLGRRIHNFPESTQRLLMTNRQTNGIEYLQQIAMAHVASRVLAAGVCLNVFNVIPPSGATAQAIAQSTQTSLRGIRILLDSLASLQLLRKSD